MVSRHFRIGRVVPEVYRGASAPGNFYPIKRGHGLLRFGHAMDASAHDSGTANCSTGTIEIQTVN